MDGHRFDNVARAFARRNSRRSLLGGIAGSSALFLATHLRLPGAAARRNTKYAGQACWDDSQCVAADTALVCAWNGYGSAGMACCAYEGSRCGDDAGCCGTSLCLGGFCGSSAAGFRAAATRESASPSGSSIAAWGWGGATRGPGAHDRAQGATSWMTESSMASSV
ncbi:MAG: hypothetical protein K0Q71_1777 [Thermomicrobiales bacterium]|nr:hypothetical protein [Thermomicrobiales bacterium]